MLNSFYPAKSNYLFIVKKSYLFFIIYWLFSLGCNNASQNRSVKSDSSSRSNSTDTTKVSPSPQTNMLYTLYLSKSELAAIFRRFGNANKVKFILFQPVYNSGDSISLAAFAGYKKGRHSYYAENDTTPIMLHVSGVPGTSMSGENVLLAGQEVSVKNANNKEKNDLKILLQMKNDSSCNYIVFVPHLTPYHGSSTLYEITYGITCSDSIPTSAGQFTSTQVTTNPTPPRNSY